MIVLHSKKSSPPAGSLWAGKVHVGSDPHGPGDLSASIGNYNAKEVLDLRRNPKTIAYGPTLPTALIKPIINQGAASSASPAVSWGLDAVRASEHGGRRIT